MSWENMNISSMYTRRVCHVYAASTIFSGRENATGAFVSPNGIRLNREVLELHTKAALFLWDSLRGIRQYRQLQQGVQRTLAPPTLSINSSVGDIG